MTLRGAAAITGFAELAPQRSIEGETMIGLLTKIGHAAIADAGVPPESVDGLLVHPVPAVGFMATTIAEQMGLNPSFAEVVDLGGAGGAGMVWRAAAAIAAGMCTTCVCVTAGNRRSRPKGGDAPKRRGGGTPPDRGPMFEFDQPYGAMGANQAYAQLAMRYHHEYKLTDSERAAVAVQQRANAVDNPKASFREPITVDDVLTSDMIVDPLHLLEIVMPSAGAAAVVVTAAERAADGPHRPVYLLGAGEKITHTSMAWAPDITDTPIAPAAKAAFDMAGAKPGDVGLASLYDCYTITVLLTLEEAGFCARGEAGRFVTERNMRWDGDFPMNTHGGQLSFGQAMVAGGMSHVTEAVLQLQGRAEGRQVPNLELAYVHGNGGLLAEQVGLVLGTGG